MPRFPKAVIFMPTDAQNDCFTLLRMRARGNYLKWWGIQLASYPFNSWCIDQSINSYRIMANFMQAKSNRFPSQGTTLQIITIGISKYL